MVALAASSGRRRLRAGPAEVQDDRSDRRPSPYLPGPSLRVPHPGMRVHDVSGGRDFGFRPFVPISRRHDTDSLVSVDRNSGSIAP